jgi:hypothetical protein
MNNGFFGSPIPIESSVLNVAQFDGPPNLGTSGTTGYINHSYAIPRGTNRLFIFAVGGGGGGGGGDKRTGANHSGGAGGSGGAFVLADFYLAEYDLIAGSSSISMSIGSGGFGGPAATADTTAGGAGGTGLGTYVWFNNSAGSGNFIIAPGGNGGAGGTTGSTTGGTGVSCMAFGPVVTAQTGGGSTTGSTGATITAIYLPYHNGTGGGGISTTNVVAIGGSIACGAALTTSTNAINGNYARASSIHSPTATGVTPVNSQQQICGLLSPGFGGSGGNAHASLAAKGMNGYRGSGGGGGGSTLNGATTSGNGGGGGAGYVCIVATRS